MKAAVSLLLLGALLSGVALAQSWMLDPVDLRLQQDPIPAPERKDRDAFADQRWGVSVPPWPDGPLMLGQPKGEVLWPMVLKREAGIGFFLGAPLPSNEPEIPSDPEYVWLIGRFESYRTLLSASERSIYTEIDYRIHRTFGKPQIPTRAGGILNVLQNGGTIRAHWGQVISYRAHTHYPPAPGHTYLLVLETQDGHNIYFERKRWDLSSGSVVPDCAVESFRPNATLSGLTVTQAVELLEKTLGGSTN